MKKIYRQITIASLAVLVSLVYLTFFLQVANNQKIAWGIKIADANIGGHNPQASQEILKEKWAHLTNQEVTLLYQGPPDSPSLEKEVTWSVKLTDLGFQIDYQATISQAYQIGRQPNILASFKEQLAALVGHYNLKPVYKIEEEKFKNKTAELFAEVEKLAQNASLVFDQESDDFILIHSTNGITIDREQLLAELSKQIQSLSLSPINLKLVVDYPSIRNNEVELARQKTQQILANLPFQLTFEGRAWIINKKRLVDWIEFEPIKEENSDNFILGLFLSQEKIKKYLTNIAFALGPQLVNAQLQTEGNRAVIFSPGKAGIKVEINQTAAQLSQNILASPPLKKTTIIAQKTLAIITLEQTNELGINTLIGQGTSNFAGSPKNRIHNIKTGAAKFNGLILSPDEEFSFNTFLGDSGPEGGFLPELVIKRKKTIPEYGGGLCQVSTTFFRAAVNTGLKITERAPHAFPVEYYYPHGFDATVYDPHPDLRFINNTPGHLLIQAAIEGTYLTFNFYGTDDGRVVKLKGPYVLESKEDGSMKTVLTQEVYQKDELIEEQTFYSNYQSPDLYPVETGVSEDAE